MRYKLILNKDYKDWLEKLKLKVRNAQLKAAVKVNSEMLLFYWSLGADIVVKQAYAKWGDGFLLQLSKDLMSEFPSIKGFSRRNLELIRQWYLFYSRDKAIAKQPVSQLAVETITQIPWGHNIVIISKCKNIREAIFYVQNTLQCNWSRNVLVHQIESGLYKREGRSITNFAVTLSKPHSDLAQQTPKDPYVFDFMTMRKDYDERDLEPANAGQLNFYIKAVDSQLCRDADQPTVGLLLCKSRDKLVAEYALSDIHKPIGISEYKLTHLLPKKLRSSFPTIEEIEKEFSREFSTASARTRAGIGRL